MLLVVLLSLVALPYESQAGDLSTFTLIRTNDESGFGNCRAGPANFVLKVRSKLQCQTHLTQSFGVTTGSFNYYKLTGVCSVFKQSDGILSYDASCVNYKVQSDSKSQEEILAESFTSDALNTKYKIVCMTQDANTGEPSTQCTAFIDQKSGYECVSEDLAELITLIHTNPKSVCPTRSLFGWVIIQQRITEELDYNGPWEEYKMGFGSVTSRFSNFWMGLESMHQLTTLAGTGESAGFMIRFELQSNATQKWYYAEYSEFWLEDESNKYRIHISGYNGTAGDIMGDDVSNNQKINGYPFTTSDRDNDASSDNCATVNVDHAGAYDSGWWYNSCTRGSTTGRFLNKFWWGPMKYAQPGAGNLLQASRVMIRKK